VSSRWLPVAREATQGGDTQVKLIGVVALPLSGAVPNAIQASSRLNGGGGGRG